MAEIAVLKYAKEFYHLLRNEAVDGVFEGSLVDAFHKVGASRTYYSSARKVLEESGSVEILQRGNRAVPSRVQVNDLARNDVLEALADSLTTGASDATLKGYIGVLARAVAELQRRLDRQLGKSPDQGGLLIVEAIRDHELRLTKLESNKATGVRREPGGLSGKATQGKSSE